MCDSDTFTQKNLYVKENISIFAQYVLPGYLFEEIKILYI